MRSKSNRQLLVTVKRSPQSTHDRSRKDAQQKQSLVFSCWLQSGDHRKVLTTEAARMRSKSNRQLLVTVKRSPQSTHVGSRKDAQQKQSLVFSCSLQSGDHRKVPTTEAARMRSKSNRQLFVTVRRSPQSTHVRSRKDAQQKQSLVFSCSLQSGDHRKVLTTEAARMRSKSSL